MIDSIRVPGITRQELLLRGALGAAAAGGLGAVGPFVRDTLAQSGRIDTEIAQFAYVLEVLERDYYERALREVPNLSPAGRRIARELHRSEVEHVDALDQLIRQLGSTVPEPPRFDFGRAFESESRFLALAQTLEETGVSAYNGAGPLVEQNDILTTAGQIVQVEARHAAWVRFERGEDITAGAFDRPLTMNQVSQRVAPYVVEPGP